MAYCGPKGLAWDEFLRWPQTSQQAALAWQARESRRCPGCGTHPDDWDPELGGRLDAYRSVAHECQGCVELQRRHQDPELQDIRGLHINLIRRT